MPYGLTSKTLKLSCKRLATKLELPVERLEEVFAEIVAEDVARMAANKREAN